MVVVEDGGGRVVVVCEGVLVEDVLGRGTSIEVSVAPSTATHPIARGATSTTTDLNRRLDTRPEG
jgi:hypothetical protein